MLVNGNELFSLGTEGLFSLAAVLMWNLVKSQGWKKDAVAASVTSGNRDCPKPGKGGNEELRLNFRYENPHI